MYDDVTLQARKGFVPALGMMMWHYVWWCGHYRQERGSCRRWGSRCLLCSWSTLVIGRFVLISSIFCWQPFGEWHSLSCSVLTNFFIHELLDASVDLRFMHTHTHRERQTRTDRHMYICMYICMYVCMYVCMHMYAYTCICSYMYTYTHTNPPPPTQPQEWVSRSRTSHTKLYHRPQQHHAPRTSQTPRTSQKPRTSHTKLCQRPDKVRNKTNLKLYGIVLLYILIHILIVYSDSYTN